jgi:hypothetical protein
MLLITRRMHSRFLPLGILMGCLLVPAAFIRAQAPEQSSAQTLIPAPERLRQPPAGRALLIDPAGPMSAFSWQASGLATGGLFFPSGNSGGATLLWREGDFAQSALLYPSASIPEKTRAKLSKIVVQYRATTVPAWKPDTPLSPTRNRIGLFVGKESRPATGSINPVTDFVPDGKLREFVMDVLHQDEAKRSRSITFCLTPTDTPNTAPLPFNTLQLDIEKIWFQMPENEGPVEKQEKRIVRLLDDQSKPLAGVKLWLVPGGLGITPQITDDSGSATFEGAIFPDAQQTAIFMDAQNQRMGYRLTGDVTECAPSAPNAVRMFSEKHKTVRGRVVTPAGPAAQAIVWVAYLPRGNDSRPVLTDEEGRFEVTYNPVMTHTALYRSVRLPDDRRQQIFARLGNLAAAAPLPADPAQEATVTLQPMVTAQLQLPGIKAPANLNRLPSVEVIGYGPAQMMDPTTHKFSPVQLIDGDTVQVSGRAPGMLQQVIGGIQVKPGMEPIRIALKPALQADFTFLDEKGLPVPNLHVMLYWQQIEYGSTDAKGTVRAHDLTPGSNGLAIHFDIPTGQYARVLGDRVWLEILNIDASIVQSIRVSPFWSSDITVLDDETGEKIPEAFVTTLWPLYAREVRMAQEYETALVTKKHMYVRVTPQENAVKLVGDNVDVVVLAKGYQPLGTALRQADLRSHAPVIRLKKAAQAAVPAVKPKP